MLLAIVLVLALVGCEGGGGAESTEPEVPLTELSSYKIVYALSSSKEVIAKIRSAVGELETAYGVRLEYGSDLDLTGAETVENGEREILVGETNRPESREAKKELPTSLSYIIGISGNKLVILGGNEEMTVAAIEAFKNILLENGRLAIAENYSEIANKTDDILPQNSLVRKIASEYTVVFPASYSIGENKVAKEFAAQISDLTGMKVKASGDRAGEQEKEILIGATCRPESEAHSASVGYYDYRISVDGSKIALNAGSGAALKWGAEALFDMLIQGSLDIEKDGEITVPFGKEDFNPIVRDLSLFTPSWSASYTPPAWMLDLAEKTYAVTCGAEGRMTFKSHRGDRACYPENSVEAIASAILAGADAIELDVRLTADGVAVLMHDETLNRTTDAGRFMSKEGFPSSEKVADWTYEQLKSLSLVDDRGVLTDYKIPTLYEALMLCSGRIFVQVDDKSGTLKAETDLYLLASETDSKECFFHYYGIDMMEKWVVFDRSDSEFAAYVEKCRSYLGENGHSLRRVYWPNDTNTYAGGLDESPERWKKLTSSGKMMIWTENVRLISEYVGANFEASSPSS